MLIILGVYWYNIQLLWKKTKDATSLDFDAAKDKVASGENQKSYSSSSSSI